MNVIIVGNASSAQAAFAKTAAAAGGMAARLSSASTTMTAIGTKMTAVGKSMTRYVTLPVVAAGAAAVHLATDFEESMSKIEGLVGVSGKQVSAWSDQILNMGQTLPQAPKELADALFFVTSAGFRGAEAMDVLTMSAKAAAAGLGETLTVADAVTSAVNSYAQSGLTAAEATDVMVAAVRTGKMPADALAGVLGAVLPVAAQMGVGFDEVAASIASATRQGLEASKAAMGLRYMLMSLMKPTAMTTAVLDDYGLSIGEVQKSLAERGLLATLTDLADTFDLTSVKGRAAFATIVGGARGFSAASILVGQNAEAVAGVFDDVTNAAGSTAKAFEVASGTAAFKFRQALTQLEDAAINLGNTLLPIITKDVIPAVQSAIKWFDDLTPSTKALTIKLAFFAALAGPLLRVAGALFKVAGGVLKFGAVLALAEIKGGLAGIGTSAAVAAGGIRSLVVQLADLTLWAAQLGAGAYIAWDSFKTNVVASTDEVNTQMAAWSKAWVDGMQAGGTAAEVLEGKLGGLNAYQLQFMGDTGRLDMVLGDLADAYTSGAITAGQYTDAVTLLGKSQQWAIDQLSTFEVTAKGLAGKIDTLQRTVARYNLELTDAQQFTLDTYIATGNLRGALDLLQQIVKDQIAPLQKYGDTEERAAREMDIWGAKAGFATEQMKALTAEARKGRGPADALARSVGSLAGMLDIWARKAAWAAAMQEKLNTAVSNWHPPTTTWAPPGGGKQGGGKATPRIIESLIPVTAPLVTERVGRASPLNVNVRLERRQFARGLDWEFTAR